MMRHLLLLIFGLSPYLIYAQYAETFSVPNKGYLLNNVDDFTGVNWTLSPWFADNASGSLPGRDATDYFSTTAEGKLACIDLDHEVYWESPLLNISAAGAVSFSVDLTWLGFDQDIPNNPCISGPYGTNATIDVIKVMYSINGGAFTMIPNVVGGAACATIGYANGQTAANGTTTVTQAGLSGTNLRIRIIVNTNANAEVVTIDNVSVPQAGVTVVPTGPQPTATIVSTSRSSCFGDNVIFTATVTSGGNPVTTGTVTFSEGATVLDADVPLNGSGQATFSTNSLSISTHTITATYNGTSDFLTSNGNIEHIVNALPTGSITVTEISGTPNDGIVCTGASVTFTAPAGFTGYLWNTGATTQTITVVPELFNASYSVVLTNGAGCSNTVVASVIVEGPPAPGISDFNLGNTTSRDICIGTTSVTLAARDFNVPPLHITFPEDVYFSANGGFFGPPVNDYPISGDIVYIPDVDNSYLGCSTYPAGSLNGKVALIDRGTCTFLTKVLNAQMAGATGVIVVNNSPGAITMGGGNSAITIPTIIISLEDGNKIKEWLLNGNVTGNTALLASSYLWSTGETTQTITVSPEDTTTYTVTITNAGGCTATSAIFTINVIPLQTWYIDADKDGFGGSSVEACDRPTDGYLLNELNAASTGTDDCDDADDTVYPGAEELCDGKDNNCNGTIDEGCDIVRTWYKDADGDGFGRNVGTVESVTQPRGFVAVGGDCHDGDPTIYPGAPELPDGKDNNCNGEVDEGLDCRVIWYQDKDGDGFGRTSNTRWSCVQPAGYVTNADDCNDGDATIYPGAPELPDGKDNNCNGEVDEGLDCRTIWYQDKDGDGFGRTSNTRWSCIQPAGYVTNADDCHDGDATIYPGAPELCDGKDNNCNGRIDEGCDIVTSASDTERGNTIKPMSKESSLALQVNIWPNPARDVLMVTLDEFEPNKKMELTLLQADGKVQTAQSLIPAIKGQQVRMDVSRMAAGYYFLLAKQQGMVVSKRVVIIR
jgi:uncharacterized repeat protein (TIGR01451 family)